MPVLIIAFAFMFATEQNVNEDDMLKVKIDEGSITDSNSVKPPIV